MTTNRLSTVVNYFGSIKFSGAKLIERSPLSDLQFNIYNINAIKAHFQERKLGREVNNWLTHIMRNPNWSLVSKSVFSVSVAPVLLRSRRDSVIQSRKPALPLLLH